MTSRFVKQSLVAASVVTIGTTILSRVFGFAREAVIANFFGTTATLDIFIIAFTVPELITFIAFAALPPALIPSLRESGESGSRRESDIFWNGLVSFLFIFAVLSGLIYIFRTQLVLWLAPTLTSAQVAEGERLVTIVAPFVFFRGIEAYFRSWLFEKKHFVVPAISSIITNVVILAAIYVLFDSLNIQSLAYGWLAASALLAVYNGIYAFALVKPSTPRRLTPSLVYTMLGVTVSVAVVEGIALIYPVIDRYLAGKYLGEGQIAALRYATFLIHIPTGMFVVAFTQASFPWISDLSAPTQRERLKALYRDSVRIILFVMTLIAAGLIIFPTEVVRLSFQRGVFDQTSLMLTSSPFMYFALGIVFYSVYVFQIKFYYARMTLLRLGVMLTGMLVLKIVLSFLLVGPMAQDGLALATSITWLAGAVMMTADLGRILKMSLRELLMPSVARIILCVGVVSGFWLILAKFWPGSDTEPLLFLLVRLSVYAASGIAIYLGLAYLFKLPEINRVADRVRSMFRSNATA